MCVLDYPCHVLAHYIPLKDRGTQEEEGRKNERFQHVFKKKNPDACD